MIIKLAVSKKKNLELLDKLTNDPAFVVSLLKNMKCENCPDSLSINIGLLKLKENEELNPIKTTIK